ncbi:poly-beta-1,6-N-acetyl-D-glucosamine biosynthesis protein PgaD [Planomicrobium sp. Y74]|uniref:poly-beta-1,6-N-acetyl-D-glucosamine biosynthesis protein PgaD n=1 Tax=Planomicrobium sp. Y74 TaxID=2478977 RepID=UPI000EF445E4|nr:poly-beta-1,6-N-acetyl-D-glucosamine biosynthesis protein PgaD [Planomicrobium sp. Y74]RLQ86685.1 poly-beta-1,6-N-acetyl-D-glucosamine biosynthesis protein PgaD [Planomicrobium sp. Y74]
MAQPRPRHEEENFLITGNRSWFRACIDLLFTLFFWGYSLVVVIFFLSATFGFNNGLTRIVNASFNTINSDIRNLVILGLAIFIVFYVILYMNRLYNKKRFGNLKRRSYPTAVSISELEALGLMDNETIAQLQREDYVVFEKNPIIPLSSEKQ